MSKYENAMKLLNERCLNDKDTLIALATIGRYPSAEGKTRPAVRMVDAYYENGAFYVSSDSRTNKALQIESNNEVAIAGLDWFTAQGKADNLGWVKDPKNAEYLAKFKTVFAAWFNDHGNEDDPNSCVFKITLTSGTIIDNDNKYGEWKYEVDFIKKEAK